MMIPLILAAMAISSMIQWFLIALFPMLSLLMFEKYTLENYIYDNWEGSYVVFLEIYISINYIKCEMVSLSNTKGKVSGQIQS